MRIIPIVIGSLGTIFERLEMELGELEIGEVKTFQITVFLKSTRILRKVLLTWRNWLFSDSSEKPSANVVVKKIVKNTIVFCCPVGSACRIHRLHLCRRVTPTNECLGYNTKQSDGEGPVMLKLWRIRWTSSLLSLPGPPLPRVVAPDRVLFIDQIELNCVFMLNWIAWNRTVLISI